jgi:exopolysaccharide production protein ExoZ
VRLQSLQALRAFAVCLVIAHHCFGWASWGAFGVDVFFVVSGFVIASSRRRSIGEFLFRRFWRIYPIYWLVSLPLIPAAAWDIPRLAASLTLWPLWGSGFSYPVLLVAWTLCFEVLFYTAAAVAMINWRWPVIAYAGAALLALTTDNRIAGFVGNPMILEFLCGVVLTRVSIDRRRGAAALFIVACIMIIVPHSRIAPVDATAGFNSAGRVVLWGIPAALLVFGALSFECHLARAKVLTRLGDASYSIYLVFAPLCAWLAPTNAPLAFCLSIVAGMVVHWTIEKPLLALPARLHSRRTALANSEVNAAGACNRR